MEIQDLEIDAIKEPKGPFDEDTIKGLMSSIKEFGLGHPLWVREGGDIIAGKKRYVACKRLGWTTVPCEVFPQDMPEDEVKVRGIHENIKRFNLPWYEQVKQEAELHEIRQKQFGKGQKGKKQGWSIRDTAEELDMAFGTLSEDIRIHEAIINDPTLKKIQDKNTARKIIFDNIKRAEQEVEQSQPKEVETDQVYFGSSEVILSHFPDKIFDGCITDPPWLRFKDKNINKDEFTTKVLEQVFRTLKDNTFLYMFVSTMDFFVYQQELPKLGFQVQQYPCMWIKEGVLTHGTRSWEYQRDVEPILVAVKGTPALSSPMLSSVFSCKVVPSAKLIHPNEKPVEVIKNILEHCSYEDALILDPFAGSGAVADACRMVGRYYVAIEKEKNYYGNILKRLGKNDKN